MHTSTRRTATILTAAAALPASLLFAGTALATTAPATTSSTAAPASRHAAPALKVRELLNGIALHHAFTPAGSATRHREPLTQPDDLTTLNGRLFTAFQNGVGPQGQPSTDGNTASTVVEFTGGGRVIRQWDITGKCDGLGADRAHGRVIATVNEDAHSSLYTITPAASGAKVRHYAYSEALPSAGGTDAVTVDNGLVIVSASAPGTTGMPAPQPTYPALYALRLDISTGVAHVTSLFRDEALAALANTGPGEGHSVGLKLTDPDSNAMVPAGAPRFGGDLELTSQGDQEQIFAGGNGRLAVLRLSQSVDDTAWVTGPGVLYGSDAKADSVAAVTGHFPARAVLTAVTPCDASSAPATCPGPGFPANYLGALNPWTGKISSVSVTGPAFEPKGLLFLGDAGRR